jgi:benzoyl-CoA reductase/2-hydroxyglutaryl-CoA dehydratase subunit BcrC/BadD/HgdB
MTVVAYCNPLVPVEWIAAHGIEPRWLRLPAANAQSWSVTRGICPYAGALIDRAGEIDADALVLTTTCDQMRYAATVIEQRGRLPVFLMNVPSTWQTVAAQELYRDELERLGRFLRQHGGAPPSNAELARMMRAYDAARAVMRAASATWPARQIAEALAELRGSQRTPHVPREESSPGTMRSMVGVTSTDAGLPLALVGGPLMDADFAIFDLLEEAGGRVVLDATEGGQRTLPRPFDPARLDADPFAELADAYFGHIPDVFRRPNQTFYDWLGRELSARQVRAIVFRRYVWCDLWHAELQRMKEWSPVPVLEIDVACGDNGAWNRLRGRVEAFLEMLR